MPLAGVRGVLVTLIRLNGGTPGSRTRGKLRLMCGAAARPRSEQRLDAPRDGYAAPCR